MPLTHLECPRCGERLRGDQVVNVCACGSPLLCRYDLLAIRHAVRREDLAARAEDLWRYHEVLPLDDVGRRVSLGEGFTPLLPAVRLGAALGLEDLWIKDEGANPTGTFKARGAAVGVSRARELGIRRLAMPTAGNAGGAWAAYAARAGLELTVVMPQDAPAINQRECALAGTRTFLVRGLISDAGAIVGRAARAQGLFDAATLREPYRIEGKKTMGYELAEQFGWELPDVVLYPAGGGVGIIGIWKALAEMRELGWVHGPDPRLVVVQAEGCQPLVQAFERGAADSTFFQGASTVASGLRVPKALGDFLALRAVRETGGTAVAVSDAALLSALELTCRSEGLWICPEGAAAVAAAGLLRAQGWIGPKERVVILNTGTGLKYPDLAPAALQVLDPTDDLPPA